MEFEICMSSKATAYKIQYVESESVFGQIAKYFQQNPSQVLSIFSSTLLATSKVAMPVYTCMHYICINAYSSDKNILHTAKT